MLTVNQLSVVYDGKAIVDEASFTLVEGEWLMLVGPNGAGKSTLVSAISQGAKYAGEVLLDGENIRSMSPKRLARIMGVLRQQNGASYAYTVEELVSLGRYAHAKGFLKARSDEDKERIENALRATGLTAQRGQSMLTLSGGELQRAFLAQVFAQDPKLLVLDEPTNHLDLPYQKQMFELIGAWLKQEGRAVLSVVHDLSLARAYGTRVILLNEGQTVADGKPADVLTPKNLSAVYGMDVYAWLGALLRQWSA